MTRPDFTRRMSIEDARSAYPLGTPVRYFPASDSRSFVRATVRSEPWSLGHGAVVIKITGRTGGVAVEHLMRDV